jgi:CDP-paratose 2-epimerase
MDVVVVTGSAGLVGGAAVRALAARFDLVLGVDNGMRRNFFGAAGPVADNLADVELIPNYRHHRADVRDLGALTAVFGEYGTDVPLIGHTRRRDRRTFGSGALRW